MTPTTSNSLSSAHTFKLSAENAFTGFNVQGKLLANIKKLPSDQRNYFILVLELFDLIKSAAKAEQCFSFSGADQSNPEITWLINDPASEETSVRITISKDSLAKFLSLYIPDLKGRHGPDYLEAVEYLFNGEISKDVLYEITEEILSGARKTLSVIGRELFDIPTSSGRKSYTYRDEYYNWMPETTNQYKTDDVYYEDLPRAKKIDCSNFTKRFTSVLGLKNHASSLMNDFQKILSRYIWTAELLEHPSETYKNINSLIGFIFFNGLKYKQEINLSKLDVASLTRRDIGKLHYEINVLMNKGSFEKVVSFNHADIKGIDLVNKQLDRISTVNSNLSGSRFENCIIARSVLRHADLSNAVFKNVFICNTDVSHIDLTGAKLINVIFISCDITGVNFGKASYQNVKVYSIPVCIDKKTRLPRDLINYTLKSDRSDHLNQILSIEDATLKINLTLEYIEALSYSIIPHQQKLDPKLVVDILQDILTCFTSDQVLNNNKEVRESVISNLYARELSIFTKGEPNEITANIARTINSSDALEADKFIKFLNVILWEVKINQLAYALLYKDGIDAVIKLARSHSNPVVKGLGRDFYKICIEPLVNQYNRLADVSFQFTDEKSTSTSVDEIPNHLPSLPFRKPEPQLSQPTKQVMRLYA